jgi:hypothetical protein
MATDPEEFLATWRGESIAIPASGIVTTVERIPVDGPGSIEAPTVPLKWSAELMQLSTVRLDHGTILTLILWSVRRIEE